MYCMYQYYFITSINSSIYLLTVNTTTAIANYFYYMVTIIITLLLAQLAPSTQHIKNISRKFFWLLQWPKVRLMKRYQLYIFMRVSNPINVQSRQQLMLSAIQKPARHLKTMQSQYSTKHVRYFCGRFVIYIDFMFFGV